MSDDGQSTDGIGQLPPYAERVDKDDGCRWVRCTVCGNEAPNLSLLDHECIYSNDLVADGGTERNGIQWRVHYKGSEPQKIKSEVMSLTVTLDGDTAVFDDPMMVMFSDDAIDKFAENVASLPFVEGIRREYRDAYEVSSLSSETEQ